MKRTRFFYTLFSLTMIAALVLAVMPLTSAHAMSGSSAQTTSLATTGNHAVTPASNIVVCRSLTVWRHHRWVTIRVCHRVHPHN